MKTEDALRIRSDYYMIENPTEEDEFMYTEALDYLIKETKDPSYMTELYDNEPFPEEDPDFYDLFRMTATPGIITFKYGLYDPDELTIEISDDDEHAIRFMDKWYRNFNELCNKGEIDGHKLTSIYDELYDFTRRETVR